MNDGFSRALKCVLVHEGGKADHPRDPGGRTYQGVTQRVYDGFRRRNGQEPRDVWSIATSERDAIYRQQYWDVVRGDQLPPGLDYVVFDGAVNSGPGQSVKWLQRALGPRYTGKVDGVVGSVTLAAVDAHPNHDALIAAICDRRMRFLRALKTWKTFGTGWSRRVSGVKMQGQAWAMGDVGPGVVYHKGGEAKANIEDAKPRPSTGPADATTGAGGAGTAVGTVEKTVTEATDKLSPLAHISEHIATIITILTVVSVAAIIGGIFWRKHVKRKAAERADALDLEAT